MPPKVKITKEEILKVALDIVRINGQDGLNARNLATYLNCSTQPIFSNYATMDDVWTEVVKAAKALYKEYVNEGLKNEIAFKGVGSAYIKFAIVEPKLFQLLFMSEQKEVKDIENTLMLIDESYEKILRSVKESYKLSEEEAKKLYQHLWVYTHGIATMCATKVCIFSGEEIGTMLTEVFSSILEKIKRSKPND